MLAALAAQGAGAQAANGDYPLIRRLDRGDTLFAQHQDDLARFYRTIGRRPGGDQSRVAVAFYSYVVQPGDKFLQLTARLSLRPDTLASLNGIESPDDLASGDQLLVPTVQAIFVAEQPRTLLEQMMGSWRPGPEAGAPQQITATFARRAVALDVYLDARFHPVERALFYRRLFRPPLASSVLTSRYGSRRSPFSGHPRFHGGIDLAAPLGAPVVAAQKGVVTAVAHDDVYGRYAVVRHLGDFATLYGHLDRTFVVAGDEVAAGAALGTVGVTGMTTGPHVHFEVRRGGTALDPAPMMSTGALPGGG